MDRREVRNGAREIKFLVPARVALAIRDWARAHLVADPHGSGPAFDEYRTTTIYMDTPALDVLRRRGSFGRAKYRLRRYGTADLVFLERKLRTRRHLVKRRTAIDIGDIARLQSDLPAEWAGSWFHRRLAGRWLEPACQIRYSRTARVLQTADGVARLTVDADIHAVAADGLRFSDDPGIAVLSDLVIVEMKYSGDSPALFRQCVDTFALSPAPVSKYRLAMGRLGHAFGPADQLVTEPLCA